MVFRWLFYLLVLGALAWGAAWLAANPGDVTLDWFGYRVDTYVGVLLVAIAAVIVAGWVFFALWRRLIGVPSAFRRARRERRQRQGYEALSRGLVAVAAGDVTEARRLTRRAERLVDDPPITMLLAAQTAQLEGDEKAAARFFHAMQERAGTEFLGVRGLLTQALKQGDWNEALTLGRRAYRLNPKSRWVVSTLYDIQTHMGQWVDAEVTLSDMTRLGILSVGETPRRRAELALKQSEMAADPGDAVRLARKALSADQTYTPAVVRLARGLVQEGRHAKAADTIETAWKRHPDAELVDVYCEARQAHDAMARVLAAKRLAARNPDHEESRLAIAATALEARLWGEARSNLEAVAGPNSPPRVCRLMAQLEEGEHGDLARARMWLMRAMGDDVPDSQASAPVAASPTPVAAAS